MMDIETNQASKDDETAGIKTITVNNRTYKYTTNDEIRMKLFHTRYASLVKFSWILYLIVCVIQAIASFGMYIYSEHLGSKIYAPTKKAQLILSIVDWCMETISEGIFPQFIIPFAEAFFTIAVALALYAGLKDFSKNWNILVCVNLGVTALFSLLNFLGIESFLYLKTESIIVGGLMIIIGVGLWCSFKGDDPENIGAALLGLGIIEIAAIFIISHYQGKVESFELAKGYKGIGVTLGIYYLLNAYISIKLGESFRSENGDNDEDD